MIVNQNEIKTRSMGFEDASEFSIDKEDLGKIFRLFSNSVYTDKEGSIVREYASNQYDAQAVINKEDEPIYIKYNSEDLSITFVDNGRGMSPEIIEKVYKKLGKSDKVGNGKLIGGYGAGKFSLHSYTSLFYLSTIYDGILYEYVVSSKEDAPPDILLVKQETTTKNNGTSIQFFLNKKEDFFIFQQAIKKQLKYFRTLITENFNIANDYKIIQGNSFLYRVGEINENGLEIAWGNIRYLINWDFLGIQKININCALYFPTNAPFTPTISREQLENTENNKHLILEKIEEFREEITELWKNQQVIDDFFTWYHTSEKQIKFGDVTMDVHDVITADYIWKPLINTNIDQKRFKQHIESIIQRFYNIRRNTRMHQNSFSYIGKNNKIFHGEKDVTNHRLSKIGWHCIITEKNLGYLSDQQIAYFYPLKYNEALKKSTLPAFDYTKEIFDIQQLIWKEITEKTIDAHSIVLSKNRSVRVKIENSEVRGKFAGSNDWRVYDLSTIEKYLYVVYTIDPDEYTTLSNFKFDFRNRKGRSVNLQYLPILTSKKYLKRLSPFLTYERFINSEMLKKVYYKTYFNNAIPPLKYVDTWETIHPMYKHKFENLRVGIKQNLAVIPYSVSELLKAKYNYTPIDAQFDRLRRKIDVLAPKGGAETLKYRLLYNYKTKLLNNVTNKIKTIRKESVDN